jgi:glycosyltransferase involved in cell wall biosynthesis
VAHVLLVSNEPVGRTMAGPGIRYRQFALQLSDRFDVTLVIPNDPDEDLPGVRVVRASDLGHRGFGRLAQSVDAVVAQQLTIATMERLARRGARVVYDLYDPLLFEALAYHQGDDDISDYAGSLSRAAMLKQILALATGSAFLCASDRQRDLWLGVLSSLGRIGFGEYAEDPSLKRLVTVVPFGIEPEPPHGESPALKGVRPGIGESDRVLLWGGGVWNWLDPLTPIRAVAELAERRDDVHLVFLGIRHPSPRVPEMQMARAAVDLARNLGVLDSKVHFNFDWVPYAERARFFLDADLGISAHFDTVETRFAFRTRLLDYFWANLHSETGSGSADSGGPWGSRPPANGLKPSRSSSTTRMSTAWPNGGSAMSGKHSSGRGWWSRSPTFSPVRYPLLATRRGSSGRSSSTAGPLSSEPCADEGSAGRPRRLRAFCGDRTFLRSTS